MQRRLFHVAMIATLLAVLAGCGSSGSGSNAGTEESAGAGEQSTSEQTASGSGDSAAACERDLVMWPSLGGEELEYAKERGAAFKEETGVGVEFLQVPFEELQKKFIQSVPSGQGPDLLYGPNDWTGVLAEGGFVADLTDRYDTSAYLDTTVDAARYNDGLWGIPEAYEVVAQYYNPEIYPEAPTTFADYENANVSGGTYALAYDIANFYFSVPFLYASGGKLFDDQGKFVLTEEEATNWLTQMRDLKAKSNFPQEITGEAAVALFSGGNSGAYFSGPWDVDTLSGSDVDWQVATLPQIDGNPSTPFLGTKLSYVSSKSDCQDAAIAFAEFLGNAESEVKWVSDINKAHLPAIKAAYEDPALADNPVIQSFQAQADSSVPFPNLTAMGQVWTPAGDALGSVINQGADPAEAAATMVQQITSGIEGQ